MGKNRISGQMRYKIKDSVAAFFASVPDGEEIKRVARFQVPPL